MGLINKFALDLLNGQVTKIKLIGDSITDGNGASNYAPPPNTNQVIFNDGIGNVFYEPTFANHCWAKAFRNFITTNYPSVEFVNAGIGGKSAKWGNANKSNWVSGAEDVVFIMLGTNDRWDCQNPLEFKANLESFLAYVNERCNTMIVMTASPSLNDNLGSYNFGMREVDNVITQVCNANNYTHISHYREILNFSRMSGVTLQPLVEDCGSHPTNDGYELMWDLIQQKLGFIDGTLLVEERNKLNPFITLSGLQYPYILSTTPITFFKKGKRTIVELTGFSDLVNFPHATSGYLTTVRSSALDMNSYQIYEPRESVDFYKRTWNFSASIWNEWKKNL